MPVACKQLFAILLLATVWHATYAEYNVTAYCTLIKKNTKLPSSESCEKFYVCTSALGDYQVQDCGTAYSFDRNKQSCQPKDNVECYYGLENPCLGKNGTHVPNVSVCGGWHYCLDGNIKGSGTCKKGEILSNGKCIYGDCAPPGATPEEEASLLPICDIMPTGVYFGDTLDCATSLKCAAEEAVPAKYTCGTGMVFDVQQVLCNYKSKTDCSRITGVDIPGSSGTEKCDSTLLDKAKPNDVVCSSYAVCDGTSWVPKTCGDGSFFDVASGKCMLRQTATPSPTCNRCEGTKGTTFVNAVDPACAKYQTCDNGAKTGDGTCTTGYFNEDSVACVTKSTTVQLDAYKAKHGACAGETPVEPTECANPCADREDVTECPNETDGCNCYVNDAGTCETCVGTITEGTCEPDDTEPEPPGGTTCECADNEGVCEDAVNTDCVCGLIEEVFDVQRALCNYKSNTDCSRISGVEIPGSSETEKCEIALRGAVKANDNICSSYSICDGTSWIPKSCANGSFWDATRQQCMLRQRATPTPTCNRCEGTKGNTFVNAVDPACIKYQVCSYGAKMGESKCTNGYFDEVSVGCLTGATTEQLNEYKAKHGACAEGSPLDPIVCLCEERVEEAECAIEHDGCNCYFNDGVCEECIGGTVPSPTVCDPYPPSVCQCEDNGNDCVDPTNPYCDCGFIETFLCVECPNGLDADDYTLCAE